MRHRTVRSTASVPTALLVAACAPGEWSVPGESPEQAAPRPPGVVEEPIVMSGAGLAGPEWALHDMAEERSLVPNVNGAPTGEDDARPRRVLVALLQADRLEIHPRSR